MALPTCANSLCRLCSRFFVGSEERAAARRQSSSCCIRVVSSNHENVLVVAQVAMALVCAGLMMRSFAVLLHTKPGFSTPEHLETMRVAILQSIASDPVAVTRTQNEIAEKAAPRRLLCRLRGRCPNGWPRA